ncbi:MAG: DUF1643 domain-containing protein [Calditrichaeota bacterium]|nr:MAG: DUF1643 domain-containing protein [Calditrichota bacterium]
MSPFRRVIGCIPAKPQAYRYLLEIQLVGVPERCKPGVVIMKNPSTADSFKSDPTIGKVESWARSSGFTHLQILNLFARRATHPGDLNLVRMGTAKGRENDRMIQSVCGTASTIILAWGNPNGITQERYDQRIAEVLRILRHKPLYCVGPPTQLGYPRHGLHWRIGMQLQRWPVSQAF